jgi:hypothetical protein
MSAVFLNTVIVFIFSMDLMENTFPQTILDWFFASLVLKVYFKVLS